MTPEEKAKAYAQEALKDELSKIEQAYLDGYKAGLAENKSLPINIDGVEYYDFGLPSGNLWSAPLRLNSEKMLCIPYCEAEKLNIPTKEEILELKEHVSVKSRLVDSLLHFSWLNKYGKKIILSTYEFWVKAEIDEKNLALEFDGKFNFIRDFMGEKHHIILVKRPNKA